MTKWEYKLVRFDNILDDGTLQESTLWNYGRMGWELVSVVSRPIKVTGYGVNDVIYKTEYVFKKPIEE